MPTLCHPDDACIGSHHEHAEVRGMASHAKYGRLEVLLMSCKVNEGDDLGGSSADVHPVQAPCEEGARRRGRKGEGKMVGELGAFNIDCFQHHTLNMIHTESGL